jgi:hypothetical protein
MCRSKTFVDGSGKKRSISTLLFPEAISLPKSIENYTMLKCMNIVFFKAAISARRIACAP